MPKRLAAALVALLTFAAVLAAVPLATAEPAEAHPKFRTVRSCVVDPPIHHCTTERVWVAHTHRSCPSGTTGTYPNCRRIEISTSEQAAEDERKREQEEAERKRLAATTTAPAPTTTAAPPPCPSGQHRHGAGRCHSHPPPTTAPPTTTTTQPPPTTTTTTIYAPPPCAAGTHRYGGTCHADHVAPCGTGTWTAHCADGYHSHEHSGPCHAADPPCYQGVDVKKIEIANGHICYTTDTKPHGEVTSCTRIPDDSELKKRVDGALRDAGAAATGLLLCAAVAPLGGAPGLLCGGAWIAATIVGEVLCLWPWCSKDEPLPVVGTNQNPSPESDDNQLTPTTAPPAFDADADGDGTVSDAEVKEAERKRLNGEIESLAAVP